MSIKNQNRFTETIVKGEEFRDQLLKNARFVNQKLYKGNPAKGLAPGAVVTLQVTEDHSDPVVNKETGEVLPDATLETVDVTIVGVPYPVPIAKGDYVEVGAFLSEASYYIDYNLILRYDGIKKIPAPNSTHEKA